MNETQLLFFEVDNPSEIKAAKERLKLLDDAIKELDKFLPKNTQEESGGYVQ